MSGYYVGVWTGECHVTLSAEHKVATFPEVVAIVEREVENGHLCNVFHTDFAADGPASDAAMRKLLADAVSP